ncbi:MAG: hypothetical protein ACFFB3_11120 [Candidatus Hodarchaeota archaeon]
MNRWRLVGISLALMVGMVALAPIQLIADDGAHEEYLWISKYLFAGSSDSDEEQASANHATDGFDGAEAEYKDISKKKLNENGEKLDDGKGRELKPYRSPAKSKSGQIPI